MNLNLKLYFTLILLCVMFCINCVMFCNNCVMIAFWVRYVRCVMFVRYECVMFAFCLRYDCVMIAFCFSVVRCDFSKKPNVWNAFQNKVQKCYFNQCLFSINYSVCFLTYSIFRTNYIERIAEKTILLPSSLEARFHN